MGAKKLDPVPPGEILNEEFLKPMELTQRDVALAIGVPYQRVNELVNGRRGITPSTALRLSRFLGTSPDFWLNLQQRWDLFHAARAEAVGDDVQGLRVGDRYLQKNLR